jgi:hypothetical protein
LLNDLRIPAITSFPAGCDVKRAWSPLVRNPGLTQERSIPSHAEQARAKSIPIQSAKAVGSRASDQ